MFLLKQSQRGKAVVLPVQSVADVQFLALLAGEISLGAKNHAVLAQLVHIWEIS